VLVEWLNRQADTALFTTSITVMALNSGLERLPEGKRKADLRTVVDFTLSRLFGPRILLLDAAAATLAARIVAKAETAGTPIGQADAQIAGIVASHYCSLGCAPA
jgi:predicted nucleic acid-binding protein